MQNKVIGFHWQKNILINRANDFGFRKTMSEFSHFCVERTEPVGKGQLLESAIFTGRFDSASNWHPLVTPSIPRILKTNGTQGIPDPWKRFQALTNCIFSEWHPTSDHKGQRFQHEKKYKHVPSKFLWLGNLFELSGLVAFEPKKFPMLLIRNSSNIEATTPSVFSGRKKTRHRFFWPRIWFPPLVQACKGVPHRPRVGRRSTPQGVWGEKRWLSVGWVENDSMILLPPNAAKKRKRQRLDHQPVPCLRIDCTGGRSRGKACRRCSCFTGELYLKSVCIYATTPIIHIIVLIRTCDIFGGYLWEVDCVLCIWHIYSQMCTISL